MRVTFCPHTCYQNCSHVLNADEQRDEEHLWGHGSKSVCKLSLNSIFPLGII